MSKLADGTLTQNLAYEYDAFDRRLAKKIDWDLDGGFETQERFVYDGDDIALVFGGYDDLQKRYLHGPGTDEVLAEENVSTGARLWMLADQLGSIRDIASDAGVVLNHVVFNAFGAPASQTNWNYSPRYAYAGREFDGETFQYFNRARYYDMYTGRFLSQDPIGFAGGDENLYRYASNSPTNYTDPSGHSSFLKGPPHDGNVFDTARWFWGGMWSQFKSDVVSGSDMLGQGADYLLDDVYTGLAQGFDLLPKGTQDLVRDQIERANRSIDILEGYFIDAPESLIGGVYDTVTHPIDAIEGLVNATYSTIQDPIGTFERAIDSIALQSSTDRGVGGLLGEIGWGFLLGRAEVPGASKLNAVVRDSRIGQVLRREIYEFVWDETGGMRLPGQPPLNRTVTHPSRKLAREAAAHAHEGGVRPTPPKSNVAKRRLYDEAQKYRYSESHPESNHPEPHFHDSNKTVAKSRSGINNHHVYPIR